MARENEFYKDLIDNLYDGVYFVDRERVITYWNKGAQRITGYSASQTIGRCCSDNLLNHVTASGVEACRCDCPLAATMEDGIPREAEVFLHHADGHRVPVLVRAAPLRNEQGEIIGAVESFSSNAAVVNTRREADALRDIAYRDALTGVGNRAFLEGRLRAVVAEWDHKQANAGLLFLDIDHFKKINDTHGHETGDRVLHLVANTIRHNLRSTDSIGRWGGEEFLVIVDISDVNGLKCAAEKVRTLVEFSTLDLNGQTLAATVSIGATLLLPADDPESFVRRADRLMYQSKSEGRNRVTIG